MRFSLRIVRWFAATISVVVGPCCAVPALAQTPVVAEPKPAEARSWEVPVDLVAGKLFVPVTVNDQGPFAFVIDTASPPTVMDSDLAARLGIELEGAMPVGGAGEGLMMASLAKGVTLKVGDFPAPRRPVWALSLNSKLGFFNGHELMGLIGNDIVQRYITTIDYAGRKAVFREPRGFKYEGAGAVLPTRVRSYTYIHGRVTPPGREPIDAIFVVDTGAGVGVALNTKFVTDHALLDLDTPKFQATVGFGLGGEVRHTVCRMDELRLGAGDTAVAIPRPVVALSQDHGGALAATGYDGIIGAEILSKFTVIFDGPGRRMILEKNATFPEPMDFDMSGLTVVADEARRHLVLYRVRDGSPAAEAGLREGDVLISLDGQPVDAPDRERVREALKRDGERRTLRIRRGEDEIEASITLRRMV
jgi:hypothetical protein